MSLKVCYTGEGLYTIKEPDYGWVLCKVDFSIEAQEKFTSEQLEGFLERFVDFVNAESNKGEEKCKIHKN